MKIALINENSQRKKNDFIYQVLTKVASKHGHRVFNYGVSSTKDLSLDYVGAGVLTGILLATHAVDFVITGCQSGEGLILAANAMPNVFCGYVADAVDAELFVRVNAGNAISIPFGKYFGAGAEINLENIFEKLFTIEEASGYPKERKEIQYIKQNFYSLEYTDIQQLLFTPRWTQIDEEDKKLKVAKLYNVLIENKDISAVGISEDEKLSVMINEEDHIREQCIESGFNLLKP